MGLLQSYGSFVLNHPGKFLTIGSITIIAFFIVSILLRDAPSFEDPLVGFEARDTIISNRLNTWRLLLDETRASANNLSLAANSASYEHTSNHYPSSNLFINNDLADTTSRLPEPPIVEMSTQFGKNISQSIFEIMDEEEEEFYRSINSTRENSAMLVHHSLGSSKAFCGKLYVGYAQVVINPGPRYSKAGLFNLNSMIAVCQLDQILRLELSLDDSLVFQRDCERFQIENRDDLGSTACCNSWSLPNYIACLNNRTSCSDITAQDIKNTKYLINLCAPYYHRYPYEECFDLSSSRETESTLALSSPTNGDRDLGRYSKSQCGSIPDKCLRCDGWIFTVMNYLVNESFMPDISSNETSSAKSSSAKIRFRSSKKDSSINKLAYTNIFLPIAKGTSLMRYYHTLNKYNFKTPYAQVKAMDLGLKNSLFERLISDDTKLFLVALISILVVITIYTWSIILSSVVLLIICLSLCLSFTIYELVLNIPVFPFMNLLAVVISFGICSDNAMLFCKHWTSDTGSEIETQVNCTSSRNEAKNKEQSDLERVLRRAVISTSITTSATACSFIISAISKVIAVRCFCIFATLLVITNYLLIVFLLPPTLVINARITILINNYILFKRPELSNALKAIQNFRKKKLELGKKLHSGYIFNLVTRFKLYLIITFITLLLCSCILVFHRPTLQPADNDDIQLLTRRHAFEQYDRSLKRQFAFERMKMSDIIIKTPNILQEPPDTLPIRVVFGVEPVDNGNHLDPQDRGSLRFDPKFDLADPNVQIWLLEFCRKLKQQRFVYASTSADLSNCFIDTFKTWMEIRTCKDPIQSDHDRSPCCQSYEFPYSRFVLDKCIGEALNSIRRTPQYHLNTNAGVRFFKNSTRVAAIIIEYQSNKFPSHSFTKMDKFFNDVDDWITWQINNTAPQALKSGWFISSNLDLLALQLELEQSTVTSILLEVAFATLTLLVGTRDLVLTIEGALTIGTIILMTVAILILLKWTLGVVEGVLISLTIGLSIDFALHYSVAYTESRKLGTQDGVIMKILEEVGSPIALAATTTSLAGMVIVWSDIMAYQELGVFLMIIATTSWLTSTFFLLPMLATIGKVLNHGEQFFRAILRNTVKLFVDRL